MMRILFFVESLGSGGKERRIVELLKKLTLSGGYEIELVLTKNVIHYDEVHHLKIPIHIIERKLVKKDPRLFLKFYSIAKKFNPDIIHAWGHMVAFYAVPTKVLLGVPLVNNEIVDSTENKKLIGKNIVFKFSDRIISNTHAGLKAYKAPLDKSNVIYNGFNFNRLINIAHPDQIREKFGVTTKHVVAMVASFSENKDYDTFIKAAISILRTNDHITFLCIGNGDDSSYKAMVTGEDSKRILFLGGQKQVESIMNICDVGVLTTNVKHHGEGISNALMEFMALGKPVITTNFGGSTELVEDDQCGYLIDAFSEKQLTERLNHLLNNESERKRMGVAALKRIQDKFSMEAMLHSFEEEYAQALKKVNQK